MASIFGDIASFGGAAIGAGSSIYGAMQGAGAAKDARKEARRAYQQQRADMAPYLKTGRMALRDLQDIYLTGQKDFAASPGYQYRVDEGRKAIERSAAAQGMLNSGQTLRQLQEYGQGAAAEEYDRGFNRTLAAAGMGGQMVPQAAGAAQNLSVNLGNAGYDAAAARTSGFSGVGNALTGLGQNQLTLEYLRSLGGR